MTVRSTPGAHDSSTKGNIAYGVSAFAGIMLATVALFQVLNGIAAIAEDDIYVRGVDYVYEFDLTTWGWVHLVIGAIGIAAGVGILLGQTWGNIAGIAIAFLGALANFAALPHYPVWSIVIIAFNVLVIWALCTELSRASRV
jgi:hypothetical protein